MLEQGENLLTHTKLPRPKDMVHVEQYQTVLAKTREQQAQLIAVSKTQPNSIIQALYDLGQRDFGENKVQELVEKFETLPQDIRWHLIGSLQRNKVKYIAPFVHLIHSIDSLRLLKEVNKQATKHERIIDVLLQFHIAQEDTKSGLNWEEAIELLESEDYAALKNVRVVGVMGMATYTQEHAQVSRIRPFATPFCTLKSRLFCRTSFV